jgi:hypothetical protein
MKFLVSGRGGNAIYGVNGSESRFTQKMLKDRGRYEKGMHDIKNMTKFAFSTAILLRGIGTRMMGKGAIRIQNGEQRYVMVFLGIV